VFFSWPFTLVPKSGALELAVPSLFQPKAFLFIPVCQDRIVDSPAWSHAAAKAGAVIFDLEDSLLPSRKSEGRGRLAVVAEKFRPFGCRLLARVNTDAGFGADVAACLKAGIEAVVIPKLRDTGEAESRGAEISRIEKEKGARFPIGPIPLLETPTAVLNSLEIARALGDCAALFFGPEDFSAELGIEPSGDNLLLAAQTVILAAAALELPAVGTVGTFSLYSPEARAEFTAILKRSRDLGFSGAFASTPIQVAPINEVFRLAEEERARMERVVEHACGCEQAVFSLGGRLYGPPMVKRYQKILGRSPKP
jgi:citrate lyase subunit beta/citryl-CoA lyase